MHLRLSHVNGRLTDRIRWLPRLVLRRRFPRYEVRGRFEIEDLTADARVDLLDVSLGGFRCTSTAAYAPGTTHTFRFPVGRTDAVTLPASIVHCYRVPGRPAEFIVGWIWRNPRVNAEGLPIGPLVILDYLNSERSPVKVRVNGRDVGRSVSQEAG